MRLLLDTHTLLWWWRNDRRLAASTRAILADPASEFVVSAASAWEIATKSRIGKLPDLLEDVGNYLPRVEDEGYSWLWMSPAHAVRAGSYDAGHGDPFDRILAAQSEIEGLPLVTRDPAFSAFPCETIW